VSLKKALFQFSSALLPNDLFLSFPIGSCFIAIPFRHNIPLSVFYVSWKDTQNSVSSVFGLSTASAAFSKMSA
jgi:hypothetical protein